METHPAEWVSYVDAGDLMPDRERALRTSAYVKSLRREGRWARIGWASRQVREDALHDKDSPLVKAGIATYEGDVHPTTRWLVDHEVAIAQPRVCYVDIETDSRVSFKERENMRVLCWSLSDDSCTVVARGRLAADTDKCERQLLEEFWRAIEGYDVVCCWNGSWDGEAFDFEVLWLRSAARGIRFERKRWLWLDLLPLFKRQNMHASESGEEKQSFKLGDICQEHLGEGKEHVPDWVVERFGPKARAGLGALAWQLWEAGGEYRELLYRYNEQDTVLLPKLMRETGYLSLSLAVSEACGLPLDTRALDPTRFVDSFLLRLGAKEGERFPTRKRVKKGEPRDQYEGAFVLHPQTVDDPDVPHDGKAWRRMVGMVNGIARNVHVADFSSMYPSIMLSFNMSPETKIASGLKGEMPPGTAVAPRSGVWFRAAPPGILTKALRHLMAQRKKWQQLKASLPPGSEEWHAAARMEGAYKTTINSFYGIIGSPWSRFHDRDIAESTTTTGAWLIERVRAEAEQRGMFVVYIDTDSVFVLGAEREQFKQFVDWCNESLFPEMLRQQGCGITSDVKLAYEKELERLILVSAKRYAGSFRHYKGVTSCTCDVVSDKTGKTRPGRVSMATFRCEDCGKEWAANNLPPVRGKPEIKGLAYKRGDTTKLARELQAKAIDMLIGGLGVHDVGEPTEVLEYYHALITSARDHVLNDPLSVEEVKLSKSVSKPLKEYITKAKKGGGETLPPPHIQVAKVLLERGTNVGEGSRVEYIVSDASMSPMRVLPAADYDGTNVDRYYVWEQVYAPTQQLLEAAFPDHDWATWGKVRPPKPRKRNRPLPGQEALPGIDAVQPVKPRLQVDAAPLAGPVRAESPAYEVKLPKGADGPRTITALVEVLARFPGGRPVVVVVGDARIPLGVGVGYQPGIAPAVRAVIASRGAA